MSREWVKKYESLVRRTNGILQRKFDVWNIANIDLEKPYGDPDYPGQNFGVKHGVQLLRLKDRPEDQLIMAEAFSHM